MLPVYLNPCVCCFSVWLVSTRFQVTVVIVVILMSASTSIFVSIPISISISIHVLLLLSISTYPAGDWKPLESSWSASSLPVRHRILAEAA